MDASQSQFKIVITGGPSAGKTTLIQILQKSLAHRIAITPETATILYKGGFIKPSDPTGKVFVQRAIFYVQKELENLVAHMNPSLPLICDRGTLDGLAYWPFEENLFFKELKTDWETELMRYHWVIQLDSACRHGYDSGNPIRSESPDEALYINERLHHIWSRHSHYFRIPSSLDFLKKIRFAEFLVNLIIRGYSLEMVKNHLARFLNN